MSDAVAVVLILVAASFGLRVLLVCRHWERASERIHEHNIRLIDTGGDYEKESIPYPSVGGGFRPWLATFDLTKWTYKQFFPYAPEAK